MDENKIVLSYQGDVEEQMDDKGIKEEDVRKVIAHAETTSAKIKNTDDGHFLAKKRLENFTCYVEYTIEGEEAAVYNVHSHVVTMNEDKE